MTGYYVTIVDGRRIGALLGPYDTHQEALDNVDRGKELALNGNDDPSNRAWWYAYGTTKIDAETLPKTVFGK
ncbi:hypothetical protein PHIM7_13 [Sinorhizobium phage phiM7]|uniref:Uncharacterized protein n=2 Tax=Emdodecavirus TaxID=1980937 RepID=S5MPB0_9CAUD|nr:hypothetical protein AB690_gp017 [Sinorhizobium phage phiM12]YP_009601138.1 hypothetical protein FDH46_gp013 [Sinorhizobium phage phiM7]AGR47655.1 hypothetical protein SmphiM12_023 [Sinorhizobium phage phiM12]AKF12561.1 hypothetical protein PHIM7_13 [Sinorhizobium phage phiM7]AKF12921.1 hypothetical protein PHIM19_14 [Sinorhizobium phage phiM19]